ncbi:MAG: hypothetical protein FWG36_09090 [Oscillospiraceae bacterium]|nr:hypothetical protein [Oscillospiraceae bacterium]
MKISDIIIDPATWLAEMWLTMVEVEYQYINNKKTDTILGHKYHCALPRKNFDKAIVSIPGKKQLDVDSDKGEVVSVKFSDLEMKCWIKQDKSRDGDNFLTPMLKGKATAITAVQSKPS